MKMVIFGGDAFSSSPHHHFLPPLLSFCALTFSDEILFPLN